MKRTTSVVLLSASLLLMSGCSSAESTGTAAEAVENAASAIQEKVQEETFVQKTSSDKHLAYVKKYIGMNAASIGYDTWGGNRMDQLGSATVDIVFVSEDGTYLGQIDDEDNDNATEDLLKDYVVTAQNFEPNTEVQIEYEKKEDGSEYDNLVSWQSISQIDLAVKKVGSLGNGPALTPGIPSRDRYTFYIADYTGRNLASAGYESLGGNFMDAYGPAVIKLDIITEDGSYVDISDASQLQQYVVVTQSVEPGTELDITYLKKENGEEYSNLIDHQNIDSITLNVKKISG